VRQVLESFGIVSVPTELTRSAAEAASVADVMGYPVVAKLSSSGLVHKTEVGGVIAHLATRAAVHAAFEDLEHRAADHKVPFGGVYVQRMITGGIETMVGVVHDRLFGPLVGFGLGGTEVEVMADVNFRVAPLTDRDVDELIASTRAAKLLSGCRGRPPADVPALTTLLLRVSAMVAEIPEILELELYPVFVMPEGQGCRVVERGPRRIEQRDEEVRTLAVGTREVAADE
jgi:acyl-CoA synthetase (NDP forming)